MFFNNRLPVLMVLLTLYDQGQTGKIIGGHVAEPHSRPYMAFIRKNLANNEPSFCDGFLLNEDFVMTAAHCQANNYTVYLGVDNTKFLKNEKIQHRTVEKAFPHENYKKNEYNDDIMLLKLSSRAVVNNFVKPVALANNDDLTLPTSCIVSGWGQTQANGGISDKLMEMNVTLNENSICTKHKLYCSNGTARPGRGDSGGPLVCGQGTAYGVVSFMSQYSADLSMVAYTKIPCYSDWITSTMKKALSKN
ncbi:PREDICTED: granzyme-like protein 2 [Poecilia mexicana]|uniref:trypsin n=1 Tax=Poecilia mexicana TaxID=48701 RepID=A0A3B3XAK4_9TELE|nr:PREDICTED: granzyme-like protein 2 [Poecilia mexicana]